MEPNNSKILKQIRLKILEMILENQNLCKLLSYNTTDPHPLNQPDIEDTTALINQNIFVQPFIPTVTTEEKTTLNVCFGKVDKYSDKYRSVELKFLIDCHYNLWLLDGDLRPDMVWVELENMFNYQNGFGFGKCIFNYRRPIYPADRWCGYEICYTLTELN